MLRLHEADWRQIRAHIADHPTQEVCGLVGGRWRPYPRLAIVAQVVAIPNVDRHPQIRYTMQPKAQVETLLAFERAKLELVGIYHSHPDGPPHPSEADIREAAWPDVVYLIGVPDGDLKAWRIQRGQTWEVALQVVASSVVASSDEDA